MKLIFLDIDGVLNYIGCSARSPHGCWGVEHTKLKLLKNIVERTDAKIILTSTWKTDWFITNYKEDLPKDGAYLEQKFREHGLYILDKTTDPEWKYRGQGIKNFMNTFCCTIDSFVIIDDESFDFIEEGLTDNFVHTSISEGLTEEDIEKAVCILNGR